MRHKALIDGIFEYRNAKYALDLVKQGEHGAKTLQEHPELMRILDRLRAVQLGRADD